MAEETLAPGHTVTRDIDGKFVKSHLTSERAAEISRTGHANAKALAVSQLLKDRGLDPDQCDSGLQALANIAISGRSGAVSALRYLDLICGYGLPSSQALEPVQPGTICPRCGQYVGEIRISGEVASKLLELMQERLPD